MGVQTTFGNLGSNFTHIELGNGIHLEGSTIEIPVLPLKLSSCRVILSIIFTSTWKSVHKHVFELIYSSQCVIIQQTEASHKPLKYIICKDVELCLFWFILKYVHTLFNISSKHSATLFNLDICNR